MVMGYMQAMWSGTWELGSESEVLFGPRRHRLINLPFSILSIYYPAQISLQCFAQSWMHDTAAHLRSLGLAINTSNSHAAGDMH